MRRIAIIGGTGFSHALISGQSETIETEYGPAQITRGDLDDTCELIFLARHGAGHHLPPHQINHRANIAALRDLEVRAVFATTAVGSLTLKIAPGDFVVLDDFLDFTKSGVTTFFDAQVRHTDFSQPYDPLLREVLLANAGDTLDAAVHPHGTYLCVSGPRYETPAEIRLFAQWGASVVGMTGVPEAILCREAGLRYAGVAVVTNYGCGLVPDTVLSHGDVTTQMARSSQILAEWLLRTIQAI